ncbi:zinc finger matrin-type protein 3-like isoform X1 [Branchiostoma floridae]|uniref:Zinc finger matrin-type protein 3-like isoform X1 n=1 Tax=Branchiostoma floridae TaxID=7739 RepID=A0A9J7MAU8_BRAFL|nr:zinc finger matrin-type protein 3-like isoform X1 [Branchiostoma floridae]
MATTDGSSVVARGQQTLVANNVSNGSDQPQNGAQQGVKRKAEDDPNDGIPPSMLQPLYCKVCNVSLNSPPQARSHYNGKNHAKKVRQYLSKTQLSQMQVSQDDESETATVAPPTCSPEKEAAGEAADAEVSEDPSRFDYCKICGVTFNSAVHAQSHYQGKPHAKRLKALMAAQNRQDGTGAATRQKSQFLCQTCNIYLNSQTQLESHLSSMKHQRKATLDKQTSQALRGRWAGADTNGRVGTPLFPVGPTFVPASSPAPSPPATKPPRVPKDLLNCITPSGKFYCAACNLTLNSEAQFRQHQESKKHRAKNAAAKKTDVPAVPT